jgi:hypothetical protein
MLGVLAITVALAACGAPAAEEVTVPPTGGSGDMMGMGGGSNDMMGMGGAQPGEGSDQTIANWQPTDDPDQVVTQVASSALFSEWLAAYPGWVGYAWQEDDGWWGVEFLLEEGDDERFLGWASVEAETGLVAEWERPRQLSDEELAEGHEAIEAIIASDPEIAALLGDPAQWEREIGSEGEGGWYAYVYRGNEAFTLYFYEEDGTYQLAELIDENAMDADQQDDLARDTAISLAFGAEGIDEVLGEADDWVALAEHQGGSVWSVSFVRDDETLFFALVDIDAGTILERSAP